MKNPHSMGKWSPDSRCHVAHMTDGDYYGSEQSHTMASAGSVRIELAMAGGDVKVLKPSVQLQAGEVIDSSMMSVRKLRAFYEREFSSAKAEGLMTSLHLKATMMKVSDPIFFGHAVSVFFSDVRADATCPRGSRALKSAACRRITAAHGCYQYLSFGTCA
eukprot:2753827-Pleurochrysis_carterae.AAC.2